MTIPTFITSCNILRNRMIEDCSDWKCFQPTYTITYIYTMWNIIFLFFGAWTSFSFWFLFLERTIGGWVGWWILQDFWLWKSGVGLGPVNVENILLLLSCFASGLESNGYLTLMRGWQGSMRTQYWLLDGLLWLPCMSVVSFPKHAKYCFLCIFVSFWYICVLWNKNPLKKNIGLKVTHKSP